jgi:hypothetical protein
VTGWLAGAWVRRGVSPIDGVRELARVFVEPSRDFAAAILGAAMAIPLLGGYAPTVFDADSSWLVLLSRDVHDNGIGVLERNQEVLIPPYVMGPLLRHGGYQWALGFGLVCLFALVGLTAYLARRVTGRTCAAVAAAAALLTMSEITNRVGILPMYAACFFLGYGGAWLVHRSMQLGLRHGGWWRAVLGGVSLVAAVETHAIGQLFYLVPFVLVVLHLRRRTIGPLMVTLASMLVAAVPRIVVNHAVGGFSNFRSNRADWIVSKGYLDLINENYFGNLRTRSPIGYLTYLPEYLNRGIGERTVLLLLFPIVLAAVTATWRSRAFVVAAAGMYVAALVVAAPSVQPRYFTPLAVGTALLVGVGVARAWTGEANARLIGASLVGVLAFAAYVQVAARVEVRHRQVQNVQNSYSERFASIVRDTGPVLGVRSQELLWTRPDIEAFVGRNMTEEDYVTYLTWPSDEAVKKVLDKYGIEWVSTVGAKFETAYVNAWLQPMYGKRAQHVTKVAESPMFCLAKTSRFNALYRYGPCQPGDPGP